MSLNKSQLEDLYVTRKMAVSEIANSLNCSENKINYWLNKYEIKKRSISEAMDLKYNPNGNPFLSKETASLGDAFLLGLGIGLYWGEGNKKNEHAVRLGNTDPYLIKAFLVFLRAQYGIDESRLRFGLQIFSDLDVEKEERFWRDFLGITHDRLYKTVVTLSGKLGTYKNKSEHGVMTIYFHSKKLRDLLNLEIERLKEMSYYAF